MRTGLRRFTLVELLVVIAILAVVAAMLLPALSSARERARTVSCLSNCRQIGLGALMYADENEEYMGRYDWEGWQFFVDVLPQLTEKETYICPSHSYGSCSSSSCGRTVLLENYLGCDISYAWNRIDEHYGEFNGRTGNQGDCGVVGKSLKVIRNPSETVMMGDGVCTRIAHKTMLDAYFRTHDSAYAVHERGANFCLADGHAARFSDMDYRWFDATR